MCWLTLRRTLVSARYAIGSIYNAGFQNVVTVLSGPHGLGTLGAGHGGGPKPRRLRTTPRRKSKLNGQLANASPRSARRDAGGNTPLNIPFGNKDVALELGARYAGRGWYAPPGVDLAAFRGKGCRER